MTSTHTIEFCWYREPLSDRPNRKEGGDDGVSDQALNRTIVLPAKSQSILPDETYCGKAWYLSAQVFESPRPSIMLLGTASLVENTVRT